jgi:hypothetical protein
LWKWPWFSAFLATLNDAGFSREKLYDLVQQIVERYIPLGGEGRAKFAKFRDKMCNRGNYTPKALRWTDKTKERVRLYRPYTPVPGDGIAPESIRYIGPDDVDWFLEREKIIVPKNFEAVEKLERLKKTQIWNFASKPEEVKSTARRWQTILIVG